MGDLHERKISQIYQSLVTNSPTTLEKLSESWEKDLGALESDDWTEALYSPREAAIVVRLRLIQFNYLHRVYHTRVRLWRAKMKASPLCLRCS